MYPMLGSGVAYYGRPCAWLPSTEHTDPAADVAGSVAVSMFVLVAMTTEKIESASFPEMPASVMRLAVKPGALRGSLVR